MSGYNFSGKNILITGASSGIGRQTAIRLSEMGAKLFITGRNPERLEETFGKLQGKGHVKVIADLTDTGQIDKVVNVVSELHGFVHCAGVSTLVPIKYIKQEQVRDVFSINYESAVLLVGKILLLKKNTKTTSFIFMSSLATVHPMFGGSLYIGSKLALEGFSKSIAIEFSSKGIRSNCICPAYVVTPMVEKVRESFSDDFIEKFKTMHPNGFGFPDDVVNIISFLLYDGSRWLNGQNINLGSFNINVPAL